MFCPSDFIVMPRPLVLLRPLEVLTPYLLNDRGFVDIKDFLLYGLSFKLGFDLLGKLK
jgi:hypothetical protein